MSDEAGAIGHDKLMDRVYARQRYIYDATRKYYLLGRDRLIAELNPAAGAHVLEIGCGTGRNLIKIARRYPQTQCYGVDISQEMLTTATASVTRAGLAKHIALAQGDATSFDPAAMFGIAAFDRIVISYALSMIPPWREVLHHAAGQLAPGGELHIVDFGDQARLPAGFKRLLAAWLARFHVTPRETLTAEMESVGSALQRDVVCRPIFRNYAILAKLSA